MVESFFPGLDTVGTIHGRDLCPKGILGLNYADVVAMLLSLIPLLLGFDLVLLSLLFNFLGQVHKFVSLLQLLLQGCHLLLGRNQLPLNLVG